MSWDDREKIKLEERTLQVGLSKDWENGENKGSREPRRPLHDSICHWCHPHNFPRRLYFTALSRFPLRVAILYFFSLWQTNCHALPVLFSSVAMATSPDLGLLQCCMFFVHMSGFSCALSCMDSLIGYERLALLAICQPSWFHSKKTAFE